MGLTPVMTATPGLMFALGRRWPLNIGHRTAILNIGRSSWALYWAYDDHNGPYFGHRTAILGFILDIRLGLVLYYTYKITIMGVLSGIVLPSWTVCRALNGYPGPYYRMAALNVVFVVG